MNELLDKFLDNCQITGFFKSIDKQISQNIDAAAIVTRPTISNGVWCCILLPAILITYDIRYNVSPIYNLTTYVAVGLLLNSFIFVIFTFISYHVLRESIYGGSIASSLISTLLVYIIFDQSFIMSLAFTLPPVCSLYALLRFLLLKCPKTFTLGEAMIVAHGILLFATMSVAKLMVNSDRVSSDVNNAIIYTFWITLGTVLSMLNFSQQLRSLFHGYSGLFVLVSCGVLVSMHLVLGMTFILNFVSYVLFNKTRFLLVLFWLFMLICSIGVVYWTVKANVKGDTIMRKSFHVLASLVFTSGILFEQDFLKLAAGIAFGLLMFVEVLRISQIDPIASVLQDGFNAYSDEKDSGCIAVTPIYLFVGLACPLLLVPEHEGFELEMLSGVLSIGVGDTAASFVGSKFGTRKWKDSNRTQEGTMANAVSQIIFVFILKQLALLRVNYAVLRVVIVASVSALVEAKTEQVDNLILPLVSIIAFQLTSIVFRMY